jgi:hypothetical protein
VVEAETRASPVLPSLRSMLAEAEEAAEQARIEPNLGLILLSFRHLPPLLSVYQDTVVRKQQAEAQVVLPVSTVYLRSEEAQELQEAPQVLLLPAMEAVAVLAVDELLPVILDPEVGLEALAAEQLPEAEALEEKGRPRALTV